MKRIIKCGTAFLLALVLCLCLLPTTAFAASKQVYIWNFPLSDDTLKSSGNWGHGVLNLRFGYRVGASSYTQFRCLDSWQGEVAYCIEPGAPQKNYDSITDHDDTWWDHLTLPDGHPLNPKPGPILWHTSIQTRRDGSCVYPQNIYIQRQRDDSCTVPPLVLHDNSNIDP